MRKLLETIWAILGGLIWGIVDDYPFDNSGGPSADSKESPWWEDKASRPRREPAARAGRHESGHAWGGARRVAAAGDPWLIRYYPATGAPRVQYSHLPDLDSDLYTLRPLVAPNPCRTGGVP
jgi:hypothetical protein